MVLLEMMGRQETQDLQALWVSPVTLGKKVLWAPMEMMDNPLVLCMVKMMIYHMCIYTCIYYTGKKWKSWPPRPTWCKRTNC